MSQKVAMHLSAGVCFVIALIFYVMGWTSPDGPVAVFLGIGVLFELVAWIKLFRTGRAKELG